MGGLQFNLGRTGPGSQAPPVISTVSQRSQIANSAMMMRQKTEQLRTAIRQQISLRKMDFEQARKMKGLEFQLDMAGKAFDRSTGLEMFERQANLKAELARIESEAAADERVSEVEQKRLDRESREDVAMIGERGRTSRAELLAGQVAGRQKVTDVTAAAEAAEATRQFNLKHGLAVETQQKVTLPKAEQEKAAAVQALKLKAAQTAKTIQETTGLKERGVLAGKEFDTKMAIHKIGNTGVTAKVFFDAKNNLKVSVRLSAGMASDILEGLKTKTTKEVLETVLAVANSNLKEQGLSPEMIELALPALKAEVARLQAEAKTSRPAPTPPPVSTIPAAQSSGTGFSPAGFRGR